MNVQLYVSMFRVEHDGDDDFQDGSSDALLGDTMGLQKIYYSSNWLLPFSFKEF